MIVWLLNIDLIHLSKTSLALRLRCLTIITCSNLLLLLLFAEQRIIEAKSKNDSVGGSITCVVRNVPSGLGEPCFDKLEAMLAHGMLSIPATKGFEIGSGFRGTTLYGHQHNDPWVKGANGRLGTKTNRSGGIQVN